MTTAPGSTTAPIRTVTAPDEAGAIAVLALAFSTDPVARWAWPDAHTYLTNFAAFAQGTAHVLGDFAGAALWLPPGTEIVEPEERPAVRAARLRGDRDDPGRPLADAVRDAAPGAVGRRLAMRRQPAGAVTRAGSDTVKVEP